MAEVSEQAKAIRRAVSGQDEEPVTLETDVSEYEAGDTGPSEPDSAPDRLLVSPDEIVQELASHDAILFELLASRAALKRLTGHDAHQG